MNGPCSYDPLASEAVGKLRKGFRALGPVLALSAGLTQPACPSHEFKDHLDSVLEHECIILQITSGKKRRRHRGVLDFELWMLAADHVL